MTTPGTISLQTEIIFLYFFYRGTAIQKARFLPAPSWTTQKTENEKKVFLGVKNVMFYGSTKKIELFSLN